jgi:hypothetical protein
MRGLENLQDENLRALTQEFFTADAKRASKLARSAIDGREDVDLSTLLRHHEERVITVEETWLRDDFDYLLAFYSVLEIAALIEFIKVNSASDVFETVEHILNYKPIKKYYRKYYRLALPQLFLKRLHGEFSVHEHNERSFSIFYSFLPLVKLIERDPDLETFLWFLDGGWRGKYNYTDVANMFRKPKKFLECFSAKRPSHLGKGVRGFVKFVHFCSEFDCLLQDSSDVPWLQAEMFAYHSYWFVQCSSKLGKRIYQGIDTLNESVLGAENTAIGATTNEDLYDRRRFNQTTRAAIGRLLSGIYSKKLIRHHLSW